MENREEGIKKRLNKMFMEKLLYFNIQSITRHRNRLH